MTNYCTCNTSTRPKADKTNHCPKCKLGRASKATKQRKFTRRENTREANHIDGYDHDDLGLSPDYDPRDD